MTLYVSEGAAITSDDVCQVIAITPQGREDFGIANAIQRHDSLDALRQLTLALDAGTHPLMLLGQIRFAAEKLPANEIGGGVTAVLRTDLALKSFDANPRVLLERLVVELCAQPKP
jgi:DNA polymerase III delta subunit